MNDDRSIERVLDRWLIEGAVNAPRRVLDGALETVASTPQWRGIRIRLPAWPANGMARALVALAAGLALVAVGLGQVPFPSVGVVPTPTPTPRVLTIEFQVLSPYGNSAESADAGDVRVSGPTIDLGTFADIVTWTPNADFTVQRTISGGKGTLVLLAHLRTKIEEMTSERVSGTWTAVSGTGAYAGLQASGTLQTAPRVDPTLRAGQPEIWTGAVSGGLP
jgi:hypothetical protein